MTACGWCGMPEDVTQHASGHDHEPESNGRHRFRATRRCPTCDSPKTDWHPAVQFEGEVSICPDPWHQPVVL